MYVDDALIAIRSGEATVWACPDGFVTLSRGSGMLIRAGRAVKLDDPPDPDGWVPRSEREPAMEGASTDALWDCP